MNEHLRFIKLILMSVFDLLQQTIDSFCDIQLCWFQFFSFILIVHHVLCHFQRLSGFDSIKTIKKSLFTASPDTWRINGLKKLFWN